MSATGRGVQVVAARAAADAGFSLEGATVAVQGFGNVGSWAARFLAREGARVVAVSDVEGAIFMGDGLDIDAADAAAKADGSVVALDGGERLTNEELLALDVDILVPAALGHVINGDNVADVRARVIVEGANAPVTPVADDALHARGVRVIPDILANAGGVTVSYFEWVQNLQQFRWDGERVDRELVAIMTRAYDAVTAMAAEHDVPLRTAAFLVGIRRVAAAVELRGFRQYE